MKTLYQLFITFFKVGAFTFGGGLAMLPVIRKEVVEVRGWLEDEEMMDCFALAQSLPGILSLNSAIYVGNKTKGVTGALAAAMAVALPAFLSILAILLFLKQIENNVYVLGAFDGIKAATVGLIFVTAWNMAKKLLVGLPEIIIAVVSFLIIVVLGISAVWGIVFGGVSGYLAYVVRKTRKERFDAPDTSDVPAADKKTESGRREDRR